MMQLRRAPAPEIVLAGAEPVRPIASQRLERPLSQQTNRVHSDKATEAIVHAWTLANKYEIDFESAMVIVVPSDMT